MVLNRFYLPLILLSIVLFTAACGSYFRATKHDSGNVEMALSRIQTPALYDVFVTPPGQDPFLLNYWMYDSNRGAIVGIYKAVSASNASRSYRYAPKMNRYKPYNGRADFDGPGRIFEIRIDATEVIHEEGELVDGAPVEIQIKDIYQLDILEHSWSAGLFRKLGGGIAAVGAATLAILPFLSCPFIYIQDGEDERFMGEVFSGSVTENMARHDFMPLPDFDPVDGVFELRIANEMKERQYTDLAALECVEHPAGLEVLMTPTGMPILFAAPHLPAEAVTDDGMNCGALVAARDGIAYDFTAPCEDRENFSSISFGFENPEGAAEAHLVLHVKNTVWSGMMYESFMSMFGNRYDDYVEHQRNRSVEQKTQWLKDQGQMLEVQLRRNGRWETVHWVNLPGPYAFRSEVVPLDLSKVDGGAVELRLVAGHHFWELDYAAIDYSEQPGLSKTSLALLSAEDEKGQDVAAHLFEVDEDYLERLFVGADATLQFQALPAPEPGNAHSVFLHTCGYYEPIREYKGTANMLELRKFKEPGYFPRFAKERFNDIAGFTP